MGDPMLTYTLLGPPRTKKNHQRILRGAGGKPTIAQSKGYIQYEKDCCGRSAARRGRWPGQSTSGACTICPPGGAST